MLERWFIVSLHGKLIPQIEACTDQDAWAEWWKIFVPSRAEEVRLPFTKFISTRKSEGFRAILLREVRP